MSSSGLIYAVIVGAWAAYLVPMWLRRQDELNEARPTERFSTAIRLLSGRAGMERRYAKGLQERSVEELTDDAPEPTDSVDVRSFALSRTEIRPEARAEVGPEAGSDGRDAGADEAGDSGGRRAKPDEDGRGRARRDRSGPGGRVRRERHAPQPQPSAPHASAPHASVPYPDSPDAQARARRSKVLARRRRTTVLLFAAFTVGAIVAAVFGLGFLWAPALPAALLSGYIVYLRGQERRRFAYTMDRRRAEDAARQLRERGGRRHADAPDEEGAAPAGGAEPRRGRQAPAEYRRQRPAPVYDDESAREGRNAATVDAPTEPMEDAQLSALAAGRRALVEQTDHAEWVDQQRERQRRPRGAGWDPVPVPLPTYVTAPVAPRATRDVDLGAPDVWSSARSGTAEPGREAVDGQRDAGEAQGGPGAPAASRDESPDGPAPAPRSRKGEQSRRSRGRNRTPLFDQYEDGEHPRAANE